MRPLDFIVFLLFFVWTVTSEESSNNGSLKYDPNSLEMNKKLMKTFLKLFYQTANRVMALKNKPEHRIDADLQNISISDILKPQNSEIQGRFFFPSESRGFFDSLNPVNAISIMSKSATGGNPKELAPNLGQTLIEIGNKALSGMNSTVKLVSDTASGSEGHSTETGSRIEQAGKESNSSGPSMRFLDDSATLDNSTITNSTITSSTITNSTDKEEARMDLNLETVSSTVEPGNATKAPEITKREASVLSLNNPSNNLNGNFPSSKITDPASEDKGLVAEPVRVIRSPASEDNNDTDDIFDFPEEKDIEDVQPIISNLKLGEIVDQFSYI